jgi:hypothetical protein
MRKNLIFLGLLATTFLVVPAFSGQGQAPGANGEQAVRKAVAAYVDAWNKRDVDGLTACLAPDADFIDEDGKPTRGHDALAAWFKTVRWLSGGGTAIGLGGGTRREEKNVPPVLFGGVAQSPRTASGGTVEVLSGPAPAARVRGKKRSLPG